MLSIHTRTQTAIAVLHDLSSSNVLQSVNYLLSEGEWKSLFDELEEGQLIRLLPQKEPGTLFSYELCRSLSEISLLDVLQAIDKSTRISMSTFKRNSTFNTQITSKINILKQIARASLEEVKISEYSINKTDLSS
ncbi:hypothetical protein [Bacteroides sp.]|uniref:hypothetical protein n=1 Tax=Bacteroides sp. TaxID=29523 RepID=UPI002A840AFC|nr:hypothetical protein [Bacteroides sp.]